MQQAYVRDVPRRCSSRRLPSRYSIATAHRDGRPARLAAMSQPVSYSHFTHPILGCPPVTDNILLPKKSELFSSTLLYAVQPDIDISGLDLHLVGLRILPAPRRFDVHGTRTISPWCALWRRTSRRRLGIRESTYTGVHRTSSRNLQCVYNGR